MIESNINFYDVVCNRLDPFFYYPEFLGIEKMMAMKNAKPLKYYIKYISSGATPEKENSELYATEDNGVPFLRVQNITEYGINLDDVAYISNDVHNGALKRTQLKSGDLLITITGRLGSAAVVPDGFKGNINQHSVKIETENYETSEIIAAFLNTEIAQKLIARRASGGTRPALDYSALKSIPIVFDKNIHILMQKAYREKQEKEKEANDLLANIDEYLLKELGIKRPDCVNDNYFDINLSYLINMKFYVKGNRFRSQRLKSVKYNEILLSEIASIKKGKSITKENISEGEYPVIAGGQTSPYSHSEFNEVENVVTVSASGAYAGYTWFHNYKIFASDCSVVRSKDETKYLTEFIYLVLHLKQEEIYKMQKGAGQPHIYSSDLDNILIPIVDFNTQTEIVHFVKTIQTKIQQIKTQANEMFDATKKQIEETLLRGYYEI